MQDFRNLKVCEAARVTRLAYDATHYDPRSEEFGLKSQMRRARVSMCSTAIDELKRMLTGLIKQLTSAIDGARRQKRDAAAARRRQHLSRPRMLKAER